MAETSLTTAKDIIRFEGSDKGAYWQRFAMLLGLAVVMATMGLLRDSGAVVIAAMLVAPLMGPILGLAAALVIGRTGRALRLVVVVWVAAAASVGLAWVIAWLSGVPDGIMLPREVLGRTEPGAEDLVIALAAGIAGAYVQIHRTEISLLPGAAIGVSLVPPLSAVGILLYFGEPARAWEALLLFATNFGAIILSAAAVYLLSGAGRTLFRSERRRLHFTLGLGVALAFLAAIFLHLVSATLTRYGETRAEAALARRLHDWAGPVSVEILRIDVRSRLKQAEVWALVDLPWEAQHRVASAADMLPERLKDTPFHVIAREVLGPDYTLVVRYQPRLAWAIAPGSDGHAPAPDADPGHNQ